MLSFVRLRPSARTRELVTVGAVAIVVAGLVGWGIASRGTSGPVGTLDVLSSDHEHGCVTSADVHLCGALVLDDSISRDALEIGLSVRFTSATVDAPRPGLRYTVLVIRPADENR